MHLRSSSHSEDRDVESARCAGLKISTTGRDPLFGHCTCLRHKEPHGRFQNQSVFCFVLFSHVAFTMSRTTCTWSMLFTGIHFSARQPW